MASNDINPLILNDAINSLIICTLDKNLNFTYANQKFCDTFSCNHEQLTNKNLRDFLDSSKASSNHQLLIHTLQKNNIWIGELQIKTRTGNIIWLDSTIKPSIGENTEQQFIGIFVDISSTKELINSLKQRAHQQGLIAILSQLSLNNIPVQDLLDQTLAVICGSLNIKKGMILKFTDDHALTVNTYNTQHCIAHETSIQIDKNSIFELVRHTASPIVSDSLKTDSRFEVPDELSQENSESAIFILIGDKKFSYGTLVLFTDSSYDLKRDESSFLKTISNILAEAINRNRIEAALKEERKKSKMYLDVAKFLILVLDIQGNILLANRHAAEVLGQPQDNLLGINFIDNFIPPELVDKVHSNYQNIVAQIEVDEDLHDIQGNVTCIIDHHKKEHFIRWRSTPITNNEGQVTSVLSSGEDITEMLAYEKEQRRLEKELNQAHKMEAIGILAGGIAHDFNNILASILGFTDLSIEQLEQLDQPDSKIHQYLTHVREAGIKARDIIAQMQNINLQDESISTPILLPSLLKSTLKMLRSALTSSIAVNVNIANDMPAVFTNAAKFNQLMMQLLVNAKNALDNKGNIDISMNLETIQQSHCDYCGQAINDKYVVLSILDNGPGISTEAIIEVVKNTVLNSKNSGLSSVSRVMHDAGGHMQIRSNLTNPEMRSQGTDIRLLFKIASEDDQEKQRNKSDIDLSSITSKHLMIVDDENSVATFLGELFRNTGFKVSVFGDPVDAVRNFENDPEDYDLIITDQIMPALTGDLLASKMLSIREDLPIILCSGHSDKMNAEKAREINIRGFVKKPVDSAELLHLVVDLLK